MKPYGKPRKAAANRNKKGTSRPCDCCVPSNCNCKYRKWRKAERQKSKTQVNNELPRHRQDDA